MKAIVGKWQSKCLWFQFLQRTSMSLVNFRLTLTPIFCWSIFLACQAINTTSDPDY